MKELPKEMVLSLELNFSRTSSCLMSSGRAFHKVGPL